jgi:hypothetical protein
MSYIGRQPTIGNFQICDAISVVNGQAAYTMQVGSVNVIPQSANHMIVSLNGTIQKPNSSFTVSGSTITFASNLATGDVIDFIQILGDVLDLGVPSDATVTTAKLADSSVSLAKLTATGTKSSSTFLRGDNTFAAAGLNGWSENGSNNDLLPANASAGIYLGVNSATAANLLDDYEEGTFTPAWYFSGGGSVAYGGQAGVYTKVGRLVSCRCYLSTSSISSPSGSASITGLPFTQKSGYEGGAAVGIAYRWGTNFSNFQFRTNENSTAISVYKQAYDGEAANLQGSDFLSGSSKNIVALGFTYEV